MIVVPVYPTPLPTPPTTQDPVNFDPRADSFLGGLPLFQTQTNALADATYKNALDSKDSATASSASAVQSSQSAASASTAAAAAASAAGATKWVTGTTYAEGKVVWSPVNGLLYRRKTAGVSTVDPSSDPAGWWLIGSPLSAPVLVINSNTTAQAGVHYVITANLTLTLPAAPSVRDTVQFTNLSGDTTVTIATGTNKVRGVSGNLTLDVEYASAILVFSGSEKGWV